MVGGRSACAVFFAGYMKTTEGRDVETFGWNVLESGKPVYQGWQVQDTAGRCIQDDNKRQKRPLPFASSVVSTGIVSYKNLSACSALQENTIRTVGKVSTDCQYKKFSSTDDGFFCTVGT